MGEWAVPLLDLDSRQTGGGGRVNHGKHQKFPQKTSSLIVYLTPLLYTTVNFLLLYNSNLLKANLNASTRILNSMLGLSINFMPICTRLSGGTSLQSR